MNIEADGVMSSSLKVQISSHEKENALLREMATPTVGVSRGSLFEFFDLFRIAP